MEPIYVIEIQAPKANISEIKRQISLRRGEILRIPERETIVNIREKVNYSPQREIFVVIKAYLPAKELAKLFSIGLKKFRTWKYQYVFDHWAVVPGYPLEEGHPSLALNFRTEMKNIKVLLKQ